jgi:hypothetical protein
LGTADQIVKKTICDFGEPWRLFRSNSGYYGSAELLQDIVFPFLSLADIAGKSCAEIGAGTGRIPLMLVEFGAADVTAIDPSDACDVLLDNTANVDQKHRPKAGLPPVRNCGRMLYLPRVSPLMGSRSSETIPTADFDFHEKKSGKSSHQMNEQKYDLVMREITPS